jgi:cold shock CspA family protein
MSKIRGNITRLVRKQGYGFILGEDGCEVYFERSGLKGLDIHSMRVGQQVEYGVQFGARARAVDISLVGVKRKLW